MNKARNILPLCDATPHNKIMSGTVVAGNTLKCDPRPSRGKVSAVHWCGWHSEPEVDRLNNSNWEIGEMRASNISKDKGLFSKSMF